MQSSTHTKSLSARQRAIAKFAYTTTMRNYIKLAHVNKTVSHFEEFSADVCVKFCECLCINHLNEKTIEFAQVAFNFAHIHYASLQSFSYTAKQILGDEYSEYAHTVAQIESQVSSYKINVANNYYTAY